VVLTLAGLLSPSAHAGLFDDDEARKAILDLRSRMSQNDDQDQAQAATIKQLTEQVQSLQRSLLDLNAQNESLRADLARLRGQDEQMLRDLSDVQRKQKDIAQGVDDRIRKLEPQSVTVDGEQFTVDPEEKAAYDDALAVLRTGDFDKASAALTAFLRKYPTSGYNNSVRFWLGNAQYGLRDYRAAIATFKAFITAVPNHQRAPEAMLAMANCQIESKDTKAARRTLQELVKNYAGSEAAAAGKDRLQALR
jgi:tol-pal system protein YbgF